MLWLCATHPPLATQADPRDTSSLRSAPTLAPDTLYVALPPLSIATPRLATELSPVARTWHPSTSAARPRTTEDAEDVPTDATPALATASCVPEAARLLAAPPRIAISVRSTVLVPACEVKAALDTLYSPLALTLVELPASMEKRLAASVDAGRVEQRLLS